MMTSTYPDDHNLPNYNNIIINNNVNNNNNNNNGLMVAFKVLIKYCLCNRTVCVFHFVAIKNEANYTRLKSGE